MFLKSNCKLAVFKYAYCLTDAIQFKKDSTEFWFNCINSTIVVIMIFLAWDKQRLTALYGNKQILSKYNNRSLCFSYKFRLLILCIVSELYCIVLYCIVSCRVVSCRVVSCRVVSCRVVSCRVVSCRVVSYRIVLYEALYWWPNWTAIV